MINSNDRPPLAVWELGGIMGAKQEVSGIPPYRHSEVVGYPLYMPCGAQAPARGLWPRSQAGVQDSPLHQELRRAGEC